MRCGGGVTVDVDPTDGSTDITLDGVTWQIRPRAAEKPGHVGELTIRLDVPRRLGRVMAVIPEASNAVRVTPAEGNG